MRIKPALLISFLLLIFPGTVSAHDIDNKVTIHMNEGGFSPQKLSINQGDTVIFENVDNNPHWPASNIHPTHSIYSEFDPKKPIKSGESWQFKFERAGVWKFHDHLYPQLDGEITVTGQVLGETEKLSLKDQLINFWQSFFITLKKFYFKSFPQNLEKELAQVDMIKAVSDESKLAYYLKIAGIQKTMAKLLEDSGNGQVIDCHQQAHKLGRLAYEIYGLQAFKTMDTSCHSGVIHGAMESFLKQKGTQHLSADIGQLCSQASTSFGRFECLHGVGHGVLAYQNYDMPKALQACQSLGDAYSEQSCYGGVFMENIIVSQGRGVIPAHQTKWVSSDPYFPCSGINQSDKVQIQCYLMQTSRMLDLNQYDFKKVADLCQKAPENIRPTCFQSLGRDAAGQTLRDPQKITNICHQVPSIYYQSCLRGALFVIVDFWGENLTDQPQQLCRRQDEQYKDLCYRMLASRLPEVFGDNKEQISKTCQFNEDPYQDTCLKVAGVSL